MQTDYARVSKRTVQEKNYLGNWKLGMKKKYLKPINRTQKRSGRHKEGLKSTHTSQLLARNLRIYRNKSPVISLKFLSIKWFGRRTKFCCKINVCSFAHTINAIKSNLKVTIKFNCFLSGYSAIAPSQERLQNTPAKPLLLSRRSALKNEVSNNRCYSYSVRCK